MCMCGQEDEELLHGSRCHTWPGSRLVDLRLLASASDGQQSRRLRRLGGASVLRPLSRHAVRRSSYTLSCSAFTPGMHNTVGVLAQRTAKIDCLPPIACGISLDQPNAQGPASHGRAPKSAIASALASSLYR